MRDLLLEGRQAENKTQCLDKSLKGGMYLTAIYLSDWQGVLL